MRFKQLHIPAFGPFTNLELQFPSSGHDLHLIYGDNEAGKSSLLRAFRDLLFGIHGQSSDNFLHDYKSLRLIGSVVNQSGEELVFQRRKGNKDTLLDEGGNAIPDAALAPYLGSIDEKYFSAMFGLGNAELHEGAAELLKGEGEVGKALFSASLGGTPIQKVLNALTEESEQLFKGRGTANVSIRPAAKRHKELLKESNKSIVHPDEWEKLEKELTNVEATKKELEVVISKLDGELDWINRCEDALPTVGRLTEETTRLKDLPSLPEVATDFVERARAARQVAQDTRNSVEVLNQRLTQLESDLGSCKTAPKVMDEADALDALHQDLGAYRTRKNSLTDLQGKLAGIEPVLQAGMKALELAGSIESIDDARLSTAIWLSCEESAENLIGEMGKHKDALGKVTQLNQEIEELEVRIQKIEKSDLTPLREALAVAAEATDASKTLDASKAEVERLTSEATDEHGMVLGAPKALDAAAGLEVPPAATIRKYQKQMEGIERDINRAHQQIRDENKTANGLRDELNRLVRRGELPSEDLLNQAREHRDHGWELVLADWKGKGAKEELEAGVPLENAFPRTMTTADGIADQLRLYAEAVAQAEERRAQIGKSEKTIEEVEQSVASLKKSMKDVQQSWCKEWNKSGIDPRTPAEMEEWRETWMDFRATLKRLRDAEASHQAKIKKVESAKEILAAALGDSKKKEFSVLFESARSSVQKGEEEIGRRKAIEEEIGNRRIQLEICDQSIKGLVKSVATATTAWKGQCKAVGIPETISPESGLNLLVERKKLIEKFDQWNELSGQAQSIEEALLEYESIVRTKAKFFGIVADTPELLEAGLWQALTNARKAETEAEQLAGQVKAAKRELEEAQQGADQADEVLKEILKLAKVAAADELEPLLANLEKRDSIQVLIDNSRETLSGLARGRDLDEFIANVQAEKAEELVERKSTVESERQEKKEELQAIREILVGLKVRQTELENAGDTAADLRQQAESVAAGLQKDASRFLRLRLATHFLQAQIERFRAENQGPLLEKSGQMFKSITCDAFEGLSAEYNDDDVPVMVGRRSDGSFIPMEGMSEGTRDQLYLALRLAALERYLDAHEPMPLILDDLLITFDDERTKAILPLLSELSNRTQIFLFTHHLHLLELCREAVGEDNFHLHKLTVRK
ncbi:AAA family ATPase [bacterium]|nr:AAA family ATPase [bacterium]